MQYFRARYETRGFSKKSVNLLAASMDNNASKSVSSSIRAWHDWCESRQVSPTSCSIDRICEFLADKLAEGKSYNGYRSAIREV
jgi:hypothetical protein